MATRERSTPAPAPAPTISGTIKLPDYSACKVGSSFQGVTIGVSIMVQDVAGALLGNGVLTNATPGALDSCLLSFSVPTTARSDFYKIIVAGQDPLIESAAEVALPLELSLR